MYYMFEGLKFSRVQIHNRHPKNLYSNLGMARLSSFMGPFRIWRRHRNLCTVRTHLVTRYHIIQQVSFGLNITNFIFIIIYVSTMYYYNYVFIISALMEIT